MLVRLLAGVAAVAAAAAFAFAQEAPKPEAKKDDKPKWDVSAPPGMVTRQVNISTDEGTWMDVDVSPDGKLIAFDLLGDIYTMPIAGGLATRIAEGLAFEMQPQFSPDGKRIAFTSDRGGGDNIWLMNVDGQRIERHEHRRQRHELRQRKRANGLGSRLLGRVGHVSVRTGVSAHARNVRGV